MDGGRSEPTFLYDGNLVLIAKHLARPRREALLLERSRHPVALDRIDQPLRPLAVAIDVPVADEGLVGDYDALPASTNPLHSSAGLGPARN